MLIRITRPGIYRNGTTQIPVGTELEVPDDFTGWANKYRVISTTAGKTLEVAAPASEPEPDHDAELEEIRAAYERQFGEKPHPRMKLETIRARLSEG